MRDERLKVVGSFGKEGNKVYLEPMKSLRIDGMKLIGVNEDGKDVEILSFSSFSLSDRRLARAYEVADGDEVLISVSSEPNSESRGHPRLEVPIRGTKRKQWVAVMGLPMITVKLDPADVRGAADQALSIARAIGGRVESLLSRDDEVVLIIGSCESCGAAILEDDDYRTDLDGNVKLCLLNCGDYPNGVEEG